MKRSAIYVLSCVLLLFTGAAVANAQSVIGDAYGVSADITRKSGEFNQREEAMERFADLGAGWMRVPMAWDNLYRSGLFQYDIYDGAMETTRIFPGKLVGTISATNTNGVTAWNSPAEYTEYLKELLTRYRHYISVWEAVPNVDAIKVSGTRVEPLQYFSILRGIHSVVKAANPQNVLVLGAISNPDAAFLDSLFAVGAYKYFDVLSFSTSQKPEKIPAICGRIRSRMEKYGFEKPVWLTSFSASSAPGSDEGEANQASHIARAHILAFASGVEKLFWNCLRSKEEDSMAKAQFNGLYHADFSPKPAVKAYKTLLRMLPAGSTRPVVEKKGTNYVASWTRPDGSKVWALWNPDGDGSDLPSVSGKPKYYDYLGSRFNGKLFQRLDDKVVYIVDANEVEYE